MPPPLPRYDRSELVVAPEEGGPGWWAGGPSAVLRDNTWWLAYRLRRPVGEGRGYANVVASSTDGVRFTTEAVLERDAFDTESLERPALVALPDGGWRLYLSLATAGTKHWRVVAVDAAHPAELDPRSAVTVLPGDERTAVKDPVIHPPADGRPWLGWICCHPLEDPGEEDRMTTRLATSADGLTWSAGEDVLRGRAGAWDARGARVTSVLAAERWAYYDGRRDASENWFERTGLATQVPGSDRLQAEGAPAASPHGAGTLRYVSAVALPEGGHRLFYEAARPDGAHELRTEKVNARPTSNDGR